MNVSASVTTAGVAARLARLREVGFTDRQAAAIGDVVDAATTEARDTMREEFARWHVYLALYLLAEIGVALLVALLMQNAGMPIRRSMAFPEADRGHAAAGHRNDIWVMVRPSTSDAVDGDDAMMACGQDLFSFVAQGENEVYASLQSWRASVYQDSTDRGAARICDSTLMSGAHTSKRAATSERYFAPKLDCDRRRFESECAYPPSLPPSVFRHQRIIARGEILPLPELPNRRQP